MAAAANRTGVKRNERQLAAGVALEKREINAAREMAASFLSVSRGS